MKSGPILFIEDDQDDVAIFKEVFDELEVKNELKFFNSAKEVVDYLFKTSDLPFIILSAVNLPVTDGTELRKFLYENEYLRKKSIPFIFLTTHADPELVKKSYQLMIQGYFEKDNDYEALKSSIKLIIDYWKHCKHPNNT